MTTPEPLYDVVWPLAPSAAPAGALAARYPGIRFVEYERLGSTHGRDEAELARTLPEALRKHGCDAVISAVGA